MHKAMPSKISLVKFWSFINLVGSKLTVLEKLKDEPLE